MRDIAFPPDQPDLIRRPTVTRNTPLHQATATPRLDLTDELVVIELVHCREPRSGKLDPWAAAILNRPDLRTYVESCDAGASVRLLGVVTKPVPPLVFTLDRTPLRRDIKVMVGLTSGALTLSQDRLRGACEHDNRLDDLTRLVTEL